MSNCAMKVVGIEAEYAASFRSEMEKLGPVPAISPRLIGRRKGVAALDSADAGAPGRRRRNDSRRPGDLPIPHSGSTGRP
jgi:hypothetical protein